MAAEQRVRDPVHNLIKFSNTLSDDSDDNILWELVQSYPVQRLRRIKQLGFSDFVYPSASHTRFSHSLGVMQMARRMFDVLTKNNVLEKGEELTAWRKATLCAALLHDVGHGPFSHVFEKVSARLDIKIDHEAFTLRIIQESQIAEILNKNGDGLLDRTLSFFAEEPGSNIYSRIVSSQLDADRLDFLLRDRYCTGIRFGELDIEWLLDSLRVATVPSDPDIEIPVQSLVLSEKGFSVAEEYLSAYVHMYLSVYFHKTTRGVELLVGETLYLALSDSKIIDAIGNKNFLVRYVKNKGNVTIEEYLALDDGSVLEILKFLAEGDFGAATQLARRFFHRELFKCFEIPLLSDGALPRGKMAEFIKRLKSEEVQFFPDTTPPKGYKQFDTDFLKNILIYSKADGEYRPIGELSRVANELKGLNKVRYYFDDDKSRQVAMQIWSSIPAAGS